MQAREKRDVMAAKRGRIKAQPIAISRNEADRFIHRGQKIEPALFKGDEQMNGHAGIFARLAQRQIFAETLALQVPAGLACGILWLLADGEFGMLQRTGSGHDTRLTHLPETASGFSCPK